MRREHGIGSRKISISVSTDDLAIISARAKRLHRGNVSAVVHEMVATLKREEAAEEVLRMLEGERITDSEMQAIRRELATPKVIQAPRRRRAT
ncbi:MAG: hypothetical protein FWD69_05340 [Polyangiaceae bacterium]|nr:hypothetical protein [Polyangiaceae bacterium]